MPETIDTAKEIIKIKKEIQDIKQSQEADMYFRRNEYEELVANVMSGNLIKIQIFLSVDGLRTRKEIQDLVKRDVGGSQPTIWRAFDTLEANGLIYKLEETKNNSPIYAKPRWVKNLRIDDYVKQKYASLQTELSGAKNQNGSVDSK